MVKVMIQFWYNIFSEVLKARRGKMKKRVILIVTIILIVFICLILINTFRNYSIIMNLKEKASSYSQLTNYHIEASSSINNKTEDFQKDNMQCRFIYRTDDEGKNTKISIYSNNKDYYNIYIDTSGENIAQISKEKTRIFFNSINNRFR